MGSSVGWTDGFGDDWEVGFSWVGFRDELGCADSFGDGWNVDGKRVGRTDILGDADGRMNTLLIRVGWTDGNEVGEGKDNGIIQSPDCGLGCWHCM